MSVTPLKIVETNTESSASIHQLAEEVRSLTEQFYCFGTSFQAALIEEGVKEKIEKLARWSGDYQRGLEAAAKLAEAGETILQEVRDRLRLGADETQRMEAESPSAHKPKNVNDASRAMMKASKQVDELIPAMEKAVAPLTETPTTQPNKE